MSRRFLTVVFGALFLASCASPADQIAFKAPQGWNSTPGIMGRVQVWMNTGQVLVLVRGPQTMTVQDAFRTSGTSGQPSQHFSDTAIKICNGQPAQLYTSTGDMTVNGKRQLKTVEAVIHDIGDQRYIATYVRDRGTKPDAQAEAALHSLCAK